LDQFTYVKRGYDPEEVDKYITTLEQVIKSYKDKDNAIKNAIISAQVAADNIARNAQMNADAYKVQINEQLSDIRATLDRQRMSLQAFQESYANMVRRCIQELEQPTSLNDLFAKLDEVETAISDLQGLDAVAGAVSGGHPVVTADPRADIRSNYQDMTTRDYLREAMPDTTREPRTALRDFEQHNRDYQRDPIHSANRDMRDVSREDIRDVMRPREAAHAPIHETLFDPDRENMRPPAREAAYMPEPIHDDRRDMPRSNGHDMQHSPVHEPMYNPDRDIRGHSREMVPLPAHEPMYNPSKDLHGQNRDMMSQPHEAIYTPDRDGRVHETMQPHNPHETLYNPDRGMVNDQNYGAQPQYTAHETMYNHDRDYQRENREIPPMRDASRDFMTEPQPMRDPGREMRRDTSRETRREPGHDIRDVRRDPNRDMMVRPSGRETMRPEPMRDNRPYMQEGPGYGDNDQNLLPPVASLM